MNSDGGEPVKLFNHEEGINQYLWSPDGRRIAFLAKDKLPEYEEKLKKEKKDAIVEDQDFQMTHLWIFDCQSKKEERLTGGDDFSIVSFDWSPDSNKIAFSATPSPRMIDYTKSDIYLVEARTLNGSAEKEGVRLPKPLKITANAGEDIAPQFTPDGHAIAYKSRQAKDLVGDYKMMRISIQGGTPEDISPKADLAPPAYYFSLDGSSVYFCAVASTVVNIYQMSLADRIPKPLTPGGGTYMPVGLNAYIPLSFDRDRTRLVFSFADSLHPGELYSAEASGFKPNKLTDINPNVRNLKLGKTELLTWRSFDGLNIEGLLLYPVDYQDGKKYPLIMNIHGGPADAFRQDFDPEGQFYSGQGYFVFKPNPRGSAGRGNAFRCANVGDWANGPYNDIMSGVRSLINKGLVDENRMGIMGWSYGGYMTAWAISQTNLFKAAVIGAGITENISAWGGQDSPLHFEAYFGGNPYEDGKSELYTKLSPFTYVRNAKTPTLILHGQDDKRVPPGQASLFYRALRANHVPTQLVWYPRTGHAPDEPNLRLDVIMRRAAWFSRYLLDREMTIWQEEQKPPEDYPCPKADATHRYISVPIDYSRPNWELFHSIMRRTKILTIRREPFSSFVTDSSRCTPRVRRMSSRKNTIST